MKYAEKSLEISWRVQVDLEAGLNWEPQLYSMLTNMRSARFPLYLNSAIQVYNPQGVSFIFIQKKPVAVPFGRDCELSTFSLSDIF